MSIAQRTIPQETIEAVARSLYRETIDYGFQQVDYLKFVNLLLDLSLKNANNSIREINSFNSGYNGKTNLRLPLIGERVQIQKFNEDDKDLLEKWIADENGRYFLLARITAKITDIDHLINSADNIIGVITLFDLSPIGVLAFLDHDKNQRKAELRKLIGEPPFRGKGLAKEATRLWIEYGISTLGLKKIYVNTLDTNIRNIRLNEELGFKVEGILRNECYFDGKYHDILKMGLWSEEFIDR